MLRFLLTVFCCGLLFFPGSVWGEEDGGLVFQFSLTPEADPNLPAPKAIGLLTLQGGLTIPAFVLPMNDAMAGEYIYSEPEAMTLDARVKPEFAGQFNAYYTGHYGKDGWFLVPKTWKPIRAAVGVTGSACFVFAPPAGKKGFLSFQDTSVCVGCAMVEASLYFPEVRAQAQEEFSSAYTSSKPPLDSIIDIRPHTKAWRVILDGQNIDGITYYNAAEDLPFFTYSVSLPEPDQDLATPILNWLLPPKK